MAEISGAMPLGELSWEPYNVTAGGGTTMSMLPNTNSVYGATQNKSTACFKFLGPKPTAQACSDACKADTQCIAFTWHDGEQPAGSASWDQQCYTVNTGCPVESHSQTHHVSGIKTVHPATNIYVAKNVEAPSAAAAGASPLSSFTGLRVLGKRAIRAR